MSKLKIAGTIIGITFFVGAIIVLLISRGSANRNKKEDDSKKNDIIEVVNTPSVNDDEIINNVLPQPTPTPEIQIVEKTVTVTKELSGVRTIAESALTNIIEEDKEYITVISNKRLVLIDENIEGENGKMLTYCFDMFGAPPDSLLLSMYVSKSNYDLFEVGQKVSVTYSVYANDAGIKFPVISSIVAVD